METGRIKLMWESCRSFVWVKSNLIEVCKSVTSTKSMRSSTNFKYPDHMPVAMSSCLSRLASRYRAVKMQVPVISVALVPSLFPIAAVESRTDLLF